MSTPCDCPKKTPQYVVFTCLTNAQAERIFARRSANGPSDEEPQLLEASQQHTARINHSREAVRPPGARGWRYRRSELNIDEGTCRDSGRERRPPDSGEWIGRTRRPTGNDVAIDSVNDADAR